MESMGPGFIDGELDLLKMLFSCIDEPVHHDPPLARDDLADRSSLGFPIRSTVAAVPEKLDGLGDYSGGLDKSSYYSSVTDPDSSNLQFFSSQECSYSRACSDDFLSTRSTTLENYSGGYSDYLSLPNEVSMYMDIFTNEGNSINDLFITEDNVVSTLPGSKIHGIELESCDDGCLPMEVSAPIEETLQLKRKPARSAAGRVALKDDNPDIEMPEKPKKKPRLSSDQQKIRKKTTPSKKNQKLNADDEEINNVNKQEGQSSSTCSSEDGDVSSQEDSKVSASLNSNGKTRASRGAATDPQSLYARKRRERINERLRILQNLIPNGTKVDISTMLEEAVHYVKFLQLQIKLLSSDDLWMYAPIAYNGKDIGLNQLLFPQQL